MTDEIKELARTIDRLVIQRDAAEATARQALARESELGLQVVAQAARLRLAASVIATLRQEGGSDSSADVRALAAWDAVPGDQGCGE
jgi:hypothetical protein